jgi:DnaJ-class molecular chaperone
MIDCPKCKGVGIKEINSVTIVNEIECQQSSLLTWCLKCDGIGKVGRIKAFYLSKKNR